MHDQDHKSFQITGAEQAASTPIVDQTAAYPSLELQPQAEISSEDELAQILVFSRQIVDVRKERSSDSHTNLAEAA